MQMAWDESRMAFCYCFCFCPTVCISVGVRSEKKDVYDRISRVVFANVQHGEVPQLPRFADADNLPTSSSMK
jgi:hypothetical protein